MLKFCATVPFPISRQTANGLLAWKLHDSGMVWASIIRPQSMLEGHPKLDLTRSLASRQSQHLAFSSEFETSAVPNPLPYHTSGALRCTNGLVMRLGRQPRAALRLVAENRLIDSRFVRN